MVSDWRATVLSFRPHHGAVAQLVAHLVRNEGVRGSSPLSSTDWTCIRTGGVEYGPDDLAAICGGQNPEYTGQDCDDGEFRACGSRSE